MSLRVRILLAFGYALLLMLVALEVPLVLNHTRRIDAEVKAQAANTAHVVAASASGSLSDTTGLDRLVARAGRDLSGRVIVVDGRGRVAADSAGPGLRGRQYRDRPEIGSALRGASAQGIRHSNTLREDLLYTAVPLVQSGRIVGAVRVTQSVDSVSKRKRRDVAALVTVGGIALLLGLGVAWLLAGSLTRPLRGLAVAARRAGAGDLDARAPLGGASDQQEVAGAFNDMAQRLSVVLSSQREFVANASHQLRTPLTGLKLRLEAARAAASDPEIDEQLAAAEVETERLAQLLVGLLTLARAGEDAPHDAAASLAEAAQAACERWEPAARRDDRELRLTSVRPVDVRSTRDDLAVVLDNLLENALRYSPGGTPVTIEVGANADRGWVHVLDEGPGIDAADAGRIFDRFARGAAGRGVGGTGLGLAIARALAERWGGTVTLSNRPQGGARAELRLHLLESRPTLPFPNPELAEALTDGG